MRRRKEGREGRRNGRKISERKIWTGKEERRIGETREKEN